MNNTLCLAVFAALVFFNDLDWQFSAGMYVYKYNQSLMAVYGLGLHLFTAIFGGATYLLNVGNLECKPSISR